MIPYIELSDNMDILTPFISLIILIYSAILHEIAHGLVADRLGDPTARLSGRLTLNPIPHIDPVMSIALPLLLILTGSPVIFGAAKPVPIDPFNFQDGKKDVALVSLAGPITNILIAVIAAGIYKFFHAYLPPLALAIVFQTIAINILLAIFNLIPIPPLDGSKVLATFLPDREAVTYLSLSSIGFVIIFVLLSPISGGVLSNFIYSILSFSLRLLGL